MNKLEVTKTFVSFVVGAGVTKIVNDIVANNSDPVNVYQKVTVGAGSAVVGMMAKDASKVYVGTKIDAIAESWKQLKAKTEEAKAEKQD